MELVAPPAQVVWHDVECGSYRADLPLWGELAAAAREDGGSIIDVGAGTGRVSLALARADHAVTALDIDPHLLRALRERAGALPVQTVCQDARRLALRRRDFALCIAPMQTVQLLGGGAGRSQFMRAARAHLRPGGVLALAIVTELEPFDCAAGDVGPAAESMRVAGATYVSRATCVRVEERVVHMERERIVLHRERILAPAGEREIDVIELDRVTAADIAREGLAAGFTPAELRTIEPTADHVGCEVVLMHA